MTKVDADNYFDAARALFWFCVDYHSGQFSTLYRVQCALEYRPAMSECGPDDEDMSGILYRELETLAADSYSDAETYAEKMLAEIVSHLNS